MRPCPPASTARTASHARCGSCAARTRLSSDYVKTHAGGRTPPDRAVVGARRLSAQSSVRRQGTDTSAETATVRRSHASTAAAWSLRRPMPPRSPALVATSVLPVLDRLLSERRRVAPAHSAVRILMLGGFVKRGQALVHRHLLVRRTVDHFHVREQTGCGEVLRANTPTKSSRRPPRRSSDRSGVAACRRNRQTTSRRQDAPDASTA
jgi:hypothetical protein